MHDGSGDCLGFGKTARAHKEQWQALTNRAWVTCHSVPAAASFAFPVFVFGQQRFIVQSPTLQGRRTSFAFHSARHCFTLVPAPLKRARRRHGPSSTHEATLAPVRRDRAGVRNQCKKKITPRRPREGITRPRKYAVARSQNPLTGAPSRSASPASARPSAAMLMTRTTAARFSGTWPQIGTRPAPMPSSRRTRSRRR